MSHERKPSLILVTGAASGIGLCFVKHYLQQPNTFVIAVDRNPIPTQNGTTSAPHNLQSYQADFSSTTAIHSLVSNIALQHSHIDLVIHSVGIRGLVPAVEAEFPKDVAAAETLECMDAETMLRTYQINTLGTFTLLQSLINSGLLNPNSRHPVEDDFPSKIVVMTSRMGSISYNTAGGAYAYRASKAALNAIVRSMSIDMVKRGDGHEMIFALVHPGRVETGITKCREEGAYTVEESVSDMLKVIDRLELQDSGRFIDRFGEDIGW